MIRLPPSSLALGERDIRDFIKRRNQRNAEEQLGLLEKLGAISVQNGPSSNTRLRRRHQGEVELEVRQRLPIRRVSISGNIDISSRSASVGIVMEHLKISPLLESVPHGDESSEDESSSNEQDYVSIRRSSAAADYESRSAKTSSPEKDGDFHYGAFTKTPSQNITGRFSPFGPEDASTPHHLQPNEPHSSRSRRPLPRSPLYLSQSTASSPELRPTFALTPRVTSRMATHSSPGIIFSAPPRRPPRNSPRCRHQTNSFSFDESESSSTAYEQGRVSSGSTSEITPRPDISLNLHEERRGSSIYSSVSITSASFLSFQDELPDTVTPRSPQRCRREFIFSSPRLTESDEEDNKRNPGRDSQTPSPQFPLPAPFSAAGRSNSVSEALPGGQVAPTSQANPVVIPSSSPTEEFQEALEHYSLPICEASQLEMGETPPQAEGAPSSSSRRVITPAQLLSRLVSRIEASYRSGSPVHRSPSMFQVSDTESASSTSRKSRIAPEEHSEMNRSYQVYNDGVAPDVQPQTPDHLPEARHRSRYHESWTAPINRSSRRRLAWPMNNNDGAGGDMPGRPVENLHATPSRGGDGLGRFQSPTGLRSRGFQGLYGGRENGHDEQSWADGVRFDNAEVRLWGLRDSEEHSDERGLNHTPEREDWRSTLR